MLNRTLLLFPLCFLLAACGSFNTRTGDAGREAYSGYDTFALLLEPTVSDTRREVLNPVAVRRLREVVGDALLSLRYDLAPAEEADFLVAVHAAQENEIDETDWGYRPPSFDRVFRPGMYDEGAVVVDIIDGQSREVVWRGVTSANVLKDPSRASLREAVEDLLDGFPTRRGF